MKRKERPHSKWLRCARFVASQYEDLEPLRSRVVTCQTLTRWLDGPGNLDVDGRLPKLDSGRSRKSGHVETIHRQLRKVRDFAVSELNTEAATTEWVVNEAELFRDLLVLTEEFPEAVFDKKEKRLSVVTKDISLERVQLGAFRIELHLDSLSSGQPYYEVIAIDPINRHLMTTSRIHTCNPIICARETLSPPSNSLFIRDACWIFFSSSRTCLGLTTHRVPT